MTLTPVTEGLKVELLRAYFTTWVCRNPLDQTEHRSPAYEVNSLPTERQRQSPEFPVRKVISEQEQVLLLPY